MNLRIKSWHGHPVTFPIIVERLNSSRVRVSEEVGTYTINPGEHTYVSVPANVIDAIREHHVPGGLMHMSGLDAPSFDATGRQVR